MVELVAQTQLSDDVDDDDVDDKAVLRHYLSVHPAIPAARACAAKRIEECGSDAV